MHLTLCRLGVVDDILDMHALKIEPVMSLAFVQLFQTSTVVRGLMPFLWMLKGSVLIGEMLLINWAPL